MQLFAFIRISMVLTALSCAVRVQADEPGMDRLILVHYQPWYQAKSPQTPWGWHWTMDKYDPEQSIAGKREIASHLYPLIGPYDSADPDVLEYHLLLMKLAGIDGVIIDWYGLQDFHDYRLLHRNVEELVRSASRLGVKLVICYEDQTIEKLTRAGKLAPGDQVPHAVSEIKWLLDNWFPLENYVRLKGRPVLLSFGQQGLGPAQWDRCLDQLGQSIAHFPQQPQEQDGASGFDWPLPDKGLQPNRDFNRSIGRFRSIDQAIPVAFPRFHDIYEQAGVQRSWGRVQDRGGETFRETLDGALETGASLVQIATWNDWGEGTVIEPSEQFGFRDLEIVQQRRRSHLDAEFPYKAADLRLPFRLFQLRAESSARSDQRKARLDRVAQWLANGKIAMARVGLEGLENER